MRTYTQGSNRAPRPTLVGLNRQVVLGHRTLVPQAKLTVNQPGDAYEQEADRVADQVMRMEEVATSRFGNGSEGLQRMCAECEEEEEVQRLPEPGRPPAGLDLSRVPTSSIAHGIQREELPVDSVVPPEEENEATLQRSVSGAAGPSHPSFESAMRQAIRGGGRDLTEATRSYMEPRFGLDFSSIRVHDDARADRLCRAISAKAFTHGNQIFFSHGVHQPASPAGRRLLAHELTHTVQQRRSGPSGVHRIQRRTPHLMRTACTAWNTVAGHALTSYNCAGLALRDYSPRSPASAVLTAIGNQGGAESVACAGPCGASKVQYWLWTYKLHLSEDTGSATVPFYSADDFHIVAGTDPNNVWSKNGKRPVYGPAAGSSWRPPAQEPATRNEPAERPYTRNGNPVTKHRTDMTEECGCFDCS